MFEIKVACPGRSWDETPIFLTGDECIFTYSASKQAALVHAIATAVAGIAQDEVRWNYKGSLQGHYVSPQDTGVCRFCEGCEIGRDCPAEISKEVNHATATTSTI